MTETANLALPEIAAAQAQKHVTHNEALRALDALVQLAVLDRTHAAPPGSPAEGARWIVAASPSGAFAGHAGHVAAWQDGGWEFYVPRAGWFAYVVAEGALIAWNGSAWVDALALLTSLQNIALLGVGTTADATNPFSAKLNNALWIAKTVTEGGDGHLRYKMSKESAAKTLSLLLQTNFSGRAEIGLTGDDDLHLKVSADGASWLDALIIDRSTARLTLAQGFADPAATRAQIAAAPLDALACNGMQVNGGMDVSQENGTSTVAIPSGAQAIYTVDQFVIVKTGTSVLGALQVSSGISGILKALRITVTTAQASIGSDIVQIRHPIEGYRFARAGWGAAAAQDVSIAFWIKAPVAGAYRVALYNSAFTASAAADVTVNAANTWELKTVKLAGVTTGTWLTTNGVGAWLIISIAFSAGPNAVGNTSYVTEITGVVAVPGVDLTAPDQTILAARLPLLMRPFDVELGLCRRYFQKSYNYAVAPGANVGLGNNAIIGTDATDSASAGWFPCLAFVPPMRAAPSMTFYDSAGTAGKASYFNGSSWVNNGTARNPVVGENQFSVVLTQNDSTANALYACDYKADARF